MVKPAAWSCWNEDMPCAVILVTEPNMYEWQSIKPLYTAPRELSRNEITEVIAEFAIKSLTNNLDYYDFAEALLKKVSEK